MNDRKIVLLAFLVCIYCLYSVHQWLTKSINTEGNSGDVEISPSIVDAVILNNDSEEAPNVIKKENIEVKKKTIPLFPKNACSVLEIFTLNPKRRRCKETSKEEMEAGGNAVTVIGITLFLLVLTVNAVLDVIKVKEEERARRKLNPDGDRRHSLAEFAKKKPLRRESSKFGLQLSQIAENKHNYNFEDEKEAPKPKYARGNSTNSYLSEDKVQDETVPATNDSALIDGKLGKRQSAAKLMGGRPSPMVRRSSFPALHLSPDVHSAMMGHRRSPDVQAAMLGHRQNSVDSDDEDKKRRVRFIRRY